MSFVYDTFSSPIGPLFLKASKKGLCALGFTPDPDTPTTTHASEDSPLFFKTKQWLENYFTDPKQPQEVPLLDLSGSSFYQHIWNKLHDIPFGKVVTYSDLARSAGYPKAARAVGRAMNQNPICLLLPCHRVIGANRSLTGYGGGLPIKEWLLKHEGIRIHNQRVA